MEISPGCRAISVLGHVFLFFFVFFRTTHVYISQSGVEGAIDISKGQIRPGENVSPVTRRRGGGERRQSRDGKEDRLTYAYVRYKIIEYKWRNITTLYRVT